MSLASLVDPKDAADEGDWQIVLRAGRRIKRAIRKVEET